MYDLIQGAVAGVLEIYENDSCKDGKAFPGTAKFLVYFTSAVDIFLLKGPAESLGVDEEDPLSPSRTSGRRR